MPANATPPAIDRGLIEKYTLRGPRYTSYPTAPEWSEDVGEAAYFKHIAETNPPDSVRPVSLYIHIPFCEERCHYCACNVIITPHKRISNQYVEYLKKEIGMVAPKIAPNRRVNQFHIGGGTPTHLTPDTLDNLLTHVDEQFAFDENPERSIEVDPRVTTVEHLKVLRAHGFNRISLGVEDFFEKTQIAINRVQEIRQTREFVRHCREHGFVSVNIDLVYGLPHQNRTTFEYTADIICELDPDRIALYNYAHLPEKVPGQRNIRESWLPDADERFAVFKTAIERFTENGLVYIGLDHFAKPNDELTLARRDGHLQRNFMGFTTRAGSDLYAFGTSAIGGLPSLYIQNVKKLNRYRDMLDADRLPIERGCELSKDDRMRRWAIMEIMCNLRVPADRFNEVWNEDFHEYFAKELSELQPFIADGLVEPNISRGLQVTELGQIMARPVAMLFDRYLREARERGRNQPSFSKTL